MKIAKGIVRGVQLQCSQRTFPRRAFASIATTEYQITVLTKTAGLSMTESTGLPIRKMSTELICMECGGPVDRSEYDFGSQEAAGEDWAAGVTSRGGYIYSLIRRAAEVRQRGR